MSTPALEDALSTIFPASRIRTDADSLRTYGLDWTRLFEPAPCAVVLPETVEEVVQVVQLANRLGLALVPSGGRTGLSGGAVAAKGELVVSLERMNRILDFDPVDRSVTVQAGVVTEVLQNHAREQGLFYPVDFASRGSSQIGGNIATNAGGINVIRWGLTRNWVRGLKVVTGRGEVLDLNRGLIKNASGVDLRQVFIGSEGTLGFVVEATLGLTRPPREPAVMVLGVPELDGVMEIFRVCQDRLDLTAFEFFSDKAMNHVLERGVQSPFDSRCSYYVLAEFENPADSAMEAALEVFESCMDRGWLEDGVISQSQTQARELWRLREDITESIARYLPYKNDIAVCIKQVPAFLGEIDALLARHYPDFEVVWFGHIGDGNLHISVLKPDALDQARFVARCQEVNELLFATLQKHGGSISAEHGVGLTKKPYLHYTRSAAEIAYLKGLKTVFDPNGIMNPGKIFD